MSKSKIEWCDETINVVTGCEPCSEGCANCYALRMIPRLMANPATAEKYRNGAKVTCHFQGLRDEMAKLSKMRPGKRVFINSMGDTFHPDVSFNFIKYIWNVIQIINKHQYVLLTKRSERMAEVFSRINRDLPNLWLGVTVESQARMLRLTDLWKTLHSHRFVSFEPLLGPVDLRLLHSFLDWVIVGGETGPKARPMDPEWVYPIMDFCQEHSIPFFFKQWGEWAPDGRGGFAKVGKKNAGRLLDGREWNETPAGY